MTTERANVPHRGGRERSSARLPTWLIVALGLLGAPRVVLHDLDILPEGWSAASLVLTVLPVVFWVVMLVARRVASPLRDGIAIGLVYGIVLGGIHQLLWHRAFEDDPPRLGGNLEGKLGEGAEEAVLRVAATFSSLGVGVALGAVAGSVSVLLLRRRTTQASDAE